MESQQVTFVETEGDHGHLLMTIAADLRASGWTVSRWRGSEQANVGLLMIDGACFDAALEHNDLRVWRFTREETEARA